MTPSSIPGAPAAASVPTPASDPLAALRGLHLPEPVGWWPLMILAIAILCELIARAGSLRRALLVGWLFGLGQFAIGLNWIATAFTFQAKMPASLGWLAVLLLSLCRLFVVHVPLHPEPFTPVLNAAFGIWLFVIAALAVARRLVRSLGDDEVAGLDAAFRLLLGPLTLLLLLGLLSHEVSAYFGHLSRAALDLGDRMGALRAERQRGLALSVLWTLFATGLLSAGLLMRSRPLFYSAYALFALTAAKVVLVDVATLPTPYRMLSFLALGALLLAGAWLNLRFRERLTAASDPGVLRS